MAASLIIVESPSKAKTIHKYLGKDFRVEASVGHIKDLPKRGYIDKQKGYKLKYVIIPGKEKVVDHLRDLAGKAKSVFLATDPDREGEAIANHLADVITEKNKNVKRIIFHEVTKKAVTEAIRHPREIDESLVSAQEARRAMDRLVGFEISPILWKAIGKGLSAGRVQSVALKWVVTRESEIQNFRPSEYWMIKGVFSTSKKKEYHAELFKVSGRVVGDDSENKNCLRIPAESDAKKYIEQIRGNSYRIEDIQVRQQKKNPSPPFITSTLQQAASGALRFSPKRTMHIAQQLYEGLDIGDELTGLITYMRTDSTRISPEAIEGARMHILENFGKEYVPAEPNYYTKNKKGKKIQDAHEAIRPTDINLTPKKIQKYLDKDQLALYQLIWSRFLACQMNPAIDEITTIDTCSQDKEKTFLFRSSYTLEIFNGFRVAGQVIKDDEDGAEKEYNRPPENIHKGENVHPENFDFSQHFTKPPPRFTAASLVKALEEKGIGRPSTYASIIDVLQNREYVQILERRFHATELGMKVSQYLDNGFSDFLNEDLTRVMEEELDEIADGETEYENVMSDFDHRLQKTLESVKHKSKEENGGMKIFALNETGGKIICPKCVKGNMVEKWKGNKKFAYCSEFPVCKNIMNTDENGQLVEQATPVLSEETCPKCGSKMVLREGRYGKFFACSAYPDCKTTRPFIDPSVEQIPCPSCGKGSLIQRRSRKRGKIFYSCSTWPDCNYALWDKPVATPCKYCDSPLLVEKNTKKEGNQIVCPKCKAAH